MIRADAIIIITEVASREYSENTTSAIKAINFHCLNMIEFDYNDLMQFISKSKPTKMGGVYIETESALQYLKNRLRAFKKLNP